MEVLKLHRSFHNFLFFFSNSRISNHIRLLEFEVLKHIFKSIKCVLYNSYFDTLHLLNFYVRNNGNTLRMMEFLYELCILSRRKPWKK